jgi:hypothetical protein
MFESLPDWIATAAIPAGSVITFFWKGDDAISPEFNQWLSQKISGAKLTVPNISSIEPLGRVFDLVYGARYFGLGTLVRVSAISIAAFIVCAVALTGSVSTVLYYLYVFFYLPNLVSPLFLLLATNIVFDYLSITKSRFLIRKTSKIDANGRAAIVIISDLILTVLLIAIYAITVSVFIGALTNIDYGNRGFGRHTFEHEYDDFIDLAQTPFLMTASMTLILSMLYSLSLMLLKFLGLAGAAMNIVWWILPIRSLPIRSVGIIAGTLLFLFLEVYHALIRL